MSIYNVQRFVCTTFEASMNVYLTQVTYHIAPNFCGQILLQICELHKNHGNFSH